ncbi:Vegetative incompatibility protein HET-E-1 [Madurella mycetomatis]|uniref:Vegetative incompatibility protein HET-E-1 n=1 Tax=Madurella mycetomatis TaxID=100816 RepID=A0A175VRI5_9PEZI|nr:Vegetative incompatibility protein HET-E-1 [Madurella mycetomatis]
MLTAGLSGLVPPYAILSHTWGDQEVTFQEIDMPEREKKKGFAKILGCCRQAQMDLIEWVWIDTCCIDKSSSAELSEAINSMYAFYRNAEICYVFLEDVPGPDPNFPLDQFVAARWFTRGWCLQELIAPCNVEFYAADWAEIGTKLSLCNVIENITAIPESVLIGGELAQCSIAQKMSWASTRRTTRIEDEAYCLLGIFGVNMPMLYGEGRRAFYRLQEEIIKQTEDYTFLLWTLMPHGLVPDDEKRWPSAGTGFWSIVGVSSSADD